MTPVSIVFDKLLLLEDGEEIVLKFTTAKELHSKRVMFYREKLKYEKADGMKVIFIRLDKHALTLTLSTSPVSLEWLENAVKKCSTHEEPLFKGRRNELTRDDSRDVGATN